MLPCASKHCIPVEVFRAFDDLPDPAKLHDYIAAILPAPLRIHGQSHPGNIHLSISHLDADNRPQRIAKEALSRDPGLLLAQLCDSVRSVPLHLYPLLASYRRAEG